MTVLADFPVSTLSPFGREVDLDLSRPFDDATAARLRELLFESGLLVFRDQKLTEERQIEVMDGFGGVLRAPEGINTVSTDPAKGWGGNAELKFHSDLAFSPYPCKVMSLYGIEMANGESATLFASGLRAWEVLPPDLKARLDGLKSRMQLPRLYASEEARRETPSWLPRTDHPAVMPHPVTGRPLIFVNEMQTACLVGVDEDESRALMDALFAHLYADENIYEHRWNRGDLVIWDNIALQHARSPLQVTATRTLRRVIVAEKRFAELYPDVPKSELVGD